MKADIDIFVLYRTDAADLAEWLARGELAELTKYFFECVGWEDLSVLVHRVPIRELPIGEELDLRIMIVTPEHQLPEDVYAMQLDSLDRELRRHIVSAGDLRYVIQLATAGAVTASNRHLPA